MTIKDRICHFIKDSGLNVRQFERSVGLSNGAVSKMGNSTRRSVLDKILAVYPEINQIWLLTGEGEMLNSMSHEETTNAQSMPVRIPLIPASAFAGGVEGFAPETLSLRNCELVISPIEGAEYAIPITGNSMEPDYADGSIAYIKRINETAFIPWGHTVILDTENGAFIKRIFPDNQDERFIWAKSINTAYPPMHIPKRSIFRIFRVLGTSRIFTTM